MSLLLLGNCLTLEIQLKSPKNKTRRGLPQIGGIMTAAWNATCWSCLCFYIEEIGPVRKHPQHSVMLSTLLFPANLEGSGAPRFKSQLHHFLYV